LQIIILWFIDVTIFFFSDYYNAFIFILYKKLFSNMNSPTSSAATKNNENDNSTLTAGFAALALGDQILHPETALNGNSTPGDLSSRSSTSTEENHTVLPFIDPGLVIQKRKHVNESWLSDFVSPKSAPQGANSALSQAVKKLVPERTACRLGK
jgi:hypothetical protein